MSHFKRFTTKNIILNGLLTLVYLLWCYYGIGTIKSEHVLLVVIWLGGYYINDTARRFVKAFAFFMLFWIIYDGMRVVPNYEVNTVHIREPYEIEKWLFGIQDLGKILTPNEYFALYHQKILDFFSGFFYINWMPIPLGFGIYLFFKNKKLFLQFSLAFLLVNIAGFIIYYLYPAAPPWYVAKYGFDLQLGVPGSRAGLARFDELINYPLFQNIYNKNANVLAAMPSLHATYPLIVTYYSIKAKMSKFWIGLFAFFTLGIWWAAVYSGHHYLIDVVAGILLASVVLFVFNKQIGGNNPFQRFLLHWEQEI